MRINVKSATPHYSATPHCEVFPPRSLCPESRLSELPLHGFQLSAQQDSGQTLIDAFKQMPHIPGVLLYDHDRWLGMLSRRRLLEFLLLPQADQLCLEPLMVLYRYTKTTPLVLSADTTILSAAQQAMRRTPEVMADPIVVILPDHTYRLLDFQDLNIAAWQLRGIETQVWYEQTQLEMLRSTRMASLGRLVDGVSHEILDPVSFIWGNLSHLGDYIRDLLSIISLYETRFPESFPAMQELKEAIEFDYLRDDMPRTLDSIKTGADRLSKLATSLQNFCHIDEVYAKPANIHECIEGVLLLIKSRLKSEIEIVKDYGHLPPVPCFIGQLSQVFMNIFTQAVTMLLHQAVTAALINPNGPNGTAKPRIRIATSACSLDGSGNRWIVVRIGHNAPLLPIALQEQITDGLADIKPLIKETELTSSYRIITAKHRGKFKVTYAPSADRLLDGGLTMEFEILIPFA
jgi:signal transduction histidine kinase